VFAHAGNAVESIASGRVFGHQLIARSSNLRIAVSRWSR
jgi:hypothetical protein